MNQNSKPNVTDTIFYGEFLAI